MFYEPRNGHGLPHNPFNAIVTPRPIGWISTRSASGIDNLAPYSFFNAVAYTPPQVMFASTASKADQDDTKDSVANIRETGVFCVNVVSYALSLMYLPALARLDWKRYLGAQTKLSSSKKTLELCKLSPATAINWPLRTLRIF